MINNPNINDLKSVSYRAGVIFPLLILLFVGLLGTSLTLGVKSGELNKTFVKPLNQLKENISQGIQRTIEENNQTNSDTVNYPSEETSTASSESTIQINSNDGSLKMDNQSSPPPQHIYVYPTQRVYPSPVPGQPGSKEWEDQFQQEWDQMNKQIQQAQQEQCARAPELCH